MARKRPELIAEPTAVLPSNAEPLAVSADTGAQSDSRGADARGPGRPRGAKTLPRLETVTLPPSCPACGSTRRKPYRDGVADDLPLCGEIKGFRYNRVIWRRTTCADCGQALTVREYRFEPPQEEVSHG
jgi:hypothetical protein